MPQAKNLINELLVDVFNHILSIEESELKKQGIKLSMTEVHVLEAIRNAEYPTMTIVSEKLRVTVGTLTTGISTLVKKGYVERKRKEEDKRVVLLSLTKSAHKVLAIHDEFHNKMVDAAFKDLNLEEDKILVKSLENVKNYFKNQY